MEKKTIGQTQKESSEWVTEQFLGQRELVWKIRLNEKVRETASERLMGQSVG